MMTTSLTVNKEIHECRVSMTDFPGGANASILQPLWLYFSSSLHVALACQADNLGIESCDDPFSFAAVKEDQNSKSHAASKP